MRLPFLWPMRTPPWSAVAETLSDLVAALLPPCCPLCREEAVTGPGVFCPACTAGIRPIASPCCPQCALPYPGEAAADHLCEHCLRKKPPYTQALAAGHYEGTLREAIHRFKYRGAIGLERPLTAVLCERLAGRIEEFSPELVVPVPLHASRLRQRTYNQAQLLARRLGRTLNLPVAARALRRTRPTDSQQLLSGRARRANLRGAFAGSVSLAGRRVLLVDDVMTTGATVEECSRELRRCGAQGVMVAVLARAVVGAPTGSRSHGPD